MRRKKIDVVIIGAGPAGLAAAVAVKRSGVKDLLLVERNDFLGGILLQCIHDGFGLHLYDRMLSGPQYAERLIEELEREGVSYLTNSMVVGIDRDRLVTIAGRSGLLQIEAGAIVLAMGCRERTRGAIEIPGLRPAGVFTAGVAQNYMNLRNLRLGTEVVILGSGDVGMIMARHVALEQGMAVKCVVEAMPYIGGLMRNKVQCLDDYEIPLHLSTTVTDIKGKDRLQAVMISEVDEQLYPVPGTEREVACDTLFLSVGLISENELSEKAGVILSARTRGAKVDDNYATNVPGIFAAGNVLHIHDVADYASLEGRRVGEMAAQYASAGRPPPERFPTHAGEGISYLLPQYLRSDCCEVELKFRVQRPYEEATIVIKNGEEVLYKRYFETILASEMQIVKVTSDRPLRDISIRVATNR